MTPSRNTGYQPEYPEIRIAHADRNDDLAGVLRVDMSREEFTTLRDEILEDIDNDKREPGSSLLIEFTPPFDVLRDALDQMISHPQNAVKIVHLGDGDADADDSDSETPSPDAESQTAESSAKPDTLSISIILNNEQAQSLKQEAVNYANADESSLVWHHELTPTGSEIFTTQAMEALDMNHAGLAEKTPN